MDAYLNALFKDTIPRAKFNRISLDKRVGGPATISIEKKCLNPIYMKMKVSDDLVTIVPFESEQGYL